MVRDFLHGAMHPRLLILLLATMGAFLQTPSLAGASAITGTVSDPSDAAIVGARVTIVGTDGMQSVDQPLLLP